MKEYWVNVYWPEERIYGLPDTRENCIEYGKFMNRKYCLHVREFETREAKELYLKMKYGDPRIIALRNSSIYKAGIFK